MITQAELKKALHYNPDTGVFTNRKSRGAAKAGKIAGCLNFYGYLIIKIDYKLYMAHRLVWLYIYGEMPVEQIDHINHNFHSNHGIL